MKKITFLLFLICGIAFSQINVSGTVTDDSGVPLSFVNVLEKGTSNGTTTSIDGVFSIEVKDNATLSFSYVGFNTHEVEVNGQTNIQVTLSNGESLDDVMLVGSRSPKRTAVNSAVPIDIIDVETTTMQVGKVEINELLQYAAPSFNASKQSGSDGADHIDPSITTWFRARPNLGFDKWKKKTPIFVDKYFWNTWPRKHGNRPECYSSNFHQKNRSIA